MADDFDLFEPLRRTKSVDLGSGKSVSVVEFTASENAAVLKAIGDSSVEKDEPWYAALAMRYVKGADYRPADDEVTRFVAAQSSATISTIVRAGMELSNAPSVSDAGKKS